MGFGFVAGLDLTIPAGGRASFEAAWVVEAPPEVWPSRSWSELLRGRLDTNVVSAIRALRACGRWRGTVRSGRYHVTWRAALSEDDASLAGTSARILGVAAALSGEGSLVVASDGTAPVPGWRTTIVRPSSGGSATLRTTRLTDRQAEEARAALARDLSPRRRPQ